MIRGIVVDVLDAGKVYTGVIKYSKNSRLYETNFEVERKNIVELIDNEEKTRELVINDIVDFDRKNKRIRYRGHAHYRD